MLSEGRDCGSLSLARASLRVARQPIADRASIDGLRGHAPQPAFTRLFSETLSYSSRWDRLGCGIFLCSTVTSPALPSTNDVRQIRAVRPEAMRRLEWMVYLALLCAPACGSSSGNETGSGAGGQSTGSGGNSAGGSSTGGNSAGGNSAGGGGASGGDGSGSGGRENNSGGGGSGGGATGSGGVNPIDELPTWVSACYSGRISANCPVCLDPKCVFCLYASPEEREAYNATHEDSDACGTPNPANCTSGCSSPISGCPACAQQ